MIISPQKARSLVSKSNWARIKLGGIVTFFPQFKGQKRGTGDQMRLFRYSGQYYFQYINAPVPSDAGGDVGISVTLDKDGDYTPEVTILYSS